MKIPADLTQYNLERPRKPVKRKLILTAEGGPATGKTDLFYKNPGGAPRPALVIQLDLNDDGLQEKIADDQDLLIKRIVVPPFTVHDEAQRVKDMALAKELRNLYVTSVTKEYFRSVMIDEGSALYTLARRSFLTDLSFGGSPQQAYEPINAYMARFYTLAKQHRVNLYIPHRQKDEREKGSQTTTGKTVAAGWKNSMYESECHVLFTKDPQFNTNTCVACDLPKLAARGSNKCTCDKFRKRDPLSKFEATITKCSKTTSVEGMMLIGEDINWPTLGTLVYPGSDESEWV